MALKLFNSMGRKLQVFRPIRGKRVGMYTCGPTVWNFAHIGNYRTFVFEDVLRRYLKFKGYRVTQVMNITDVEDNIIKGMRQFKMSRKDLTDFYERAFMKDLGTLNVDKAEFYPRATEHIPEMVALVKKLLKKGYAYPAPDGSIYFHISKFKRYGRLSGIKPSELKTGVRVAQDHYEKREVSDFALWKAWDEDDGEVFWETELGKGRPGWSLECSAMSMKYLGSSFDIHTGGIDNKFPHHENEIAQSEAATGRRFVRYWLHSEHMRMRGEGMHKSVGNVVYLKDLVEQGRHPLAIRLFLISSRYRDPLDMSDAQLDQAEAQRRKLQDFILRLRSVKFEKGRMSLARKLLSGFTAGMDDDLNTAAALGAVFGTIRQANSAIDTGKMGRAEAEALLAVMKRIDSVLGVMNFEQERVSSDAAALIARREDARKRRDFEEADRIREELSEMGIVIEDTPTGPVWKRREAG